jgi:hypothetical protein
MCSGDGTKLDLKLGWFFFNCENDQNQRFKKSK